MNTKSFVKKIGALTLLISVNGAEGMGSEQMLEIQQKIDELASTMHSHMYADGNSDVTYAQIKDSLRDHIGVRFIRDIAPFKDERPSIDDYLNLQGEDRLKAHRHNKKHKLLYRTQVHVFTGNRGTATEGRNRCLRKHDRPNNCFLKFRIFRNVKVFNVLRLFCNSVLFGGIWTFSTLFSDSSRKTT